MFVAIQRRVHGAAVGDNHYIATGLWEEQWLAGRVSSTVVAAVNEGLVQQQGRQIEIYASIGEGWYSVTLSSVLL